MPYFGNCVFTIAVCLSTSSELFCPNDIPSSTFFSSFSASWIVIPTILGTITSSSLFSSVSLSFMTSKYGSTSPNTCEAIGAATPPPWCPPSPVGLYKVIRITTSGSDIGAVPINEVTYLFVLTPSSDVPVFPPIRYPCT